MKEYSEQLYTVGTEINKYMKNLDSILVEIKNMDNCVSEFDKNSNEWEEKKHKRQQNKILIKNTIIKSLGVLSLIALVATTNVVPLPIIIAVTSIIGLTSSVSIISKIFKNKKLTKDIQRSSQEVKINLWKYKTCKDKSKELKETYKNSLSKDSELYVLKERYEELLSNIPKTLKKEECDIDELASKISSYRKYREILNQLNILEEKHIEEKNKISTKEDIGRIKTKAYWRSKKAA